MYRQIPLHPQVWQLYAYAFDGRVWHNTRMPFGGSDFPHIASALSSEAQLVLAAHGVPSTVILDDFGISAPTTDECSHRLQVALDLLQQLGWPINLRKVTSPASTVVFLGYHINLEDLTVSIPTARLRHILQRFQLLRQRGFYTARDFRSLGGRLEWVVSVFPLGRPYISYFHQAGARFSNPSARITPSRQLQADICWWEAQLESLLVSGAPGWSRVWSTSVPTPIRILSDASGSSGFGVVVGSLIIHGNWRLPPSIPSTIFELLPLLVVLKLLGPSFPNAIFVFSTDNIGTAIAINRGSSSNPLLNALLRSVASLAAPHNISTVGDWFPRALLSTCDHLSRTPPSSFPALLH